MEKLTFKRSLLMIIPLIIVVFMSCAKDNDIFLDAVLDEKQETIQDIGGENAAQDEVTTNEPTGTNDNQFYQVMFTDKQINQMISRFESGFSKAGTNGEDISRMISEAEQFLSNPSTGRLDWMPSSNLRECLLGCDPVPTNIVNG